MQDNHYLPVNWTDGMKINKTHFIAQDNAHVFQLAQNTSCLLNELNYGLLPLREGGNGLKIVISSDNQKKLQVRIQKCRAITAGGYYIEINDDTALPGNNLTTPVVSLPMTLRELKSKSNEFYIVLTINPFERVPFGTIQSPETPPRIPFTVPLLSVDLVPVGEVTKNIIGRYQLPVGKMMIEDQRVMLEEDYIPPCTSLSSHSELLDIHAGLEQFYSKMEVYALQIIQKIVQKKQTNDLSVIVQKLCENISFFTSGQLTEMKSFGVIQPAVYSVTRIASLARMMKNTMDCFIGSGKEELVNYLTEWSNIKQGELEGAITALSNHQYDHIDINDSISKVSVFTKLISKLFYQLSRLEYIGKRKEAGIFVKEEVLKQESTPQKRRSFLAD
ncbi:MAG: hypothetical protein H7Y27_09785 [Gemmatimonadaceae bacterium]|nr:hypothetical protein [Chitinophagaceae bacterium]